MNRSFNTRKFLGVLAMGTLASAAIGALLSTKRESSKITEFTNDVKNITRNLEKKARRQARNLQKEEWVENEKEKIMNHAK
ncbi:MAG: hypothetical protein ACM3O8_09615 [Methylococcaceae bacterium]|nr:hypothetical protein [Prolixibacteraceae bacterium]